MCLYYSIEKYCQELPDFIYLLSALWMPERFCVIAVGPRIYLPLSILKAAPQRNGHLTLDTKYKDENSDAASLNLHSLCFKRRDWVKTFR